MADKWRADINGGRWFKDLGNGTYAEYSYIAGGNVSVELGDIQLGSIQILGANGVDLAAVDVAGRLSFNLPADAATEASLAQAVSALGNLVTSAAAASTAALQSAGNTSLTSIDGKLTAPLSVAQSGTWTVAVSNVSLAVTGPLTDAQLRASQVPVSGPLTDAQLRASAVPVSAATLPLPSGAAIETGDGASYCDCAARPSRQSHG